MSQDLAHPEPGCAEGKRDVVPANQVLLQGGANAVFFPVVLLHSSQRCGGGRDNSLKEHLPFCLPPCCHHWIDRGKNWPPFIVQKLKEQRTWFPFRSPHIQGASISSTLWQIHPFRELCEALHRPEKQVADFYATWTLNVT